MRFLKIFSCCFCVFVLTTLHLQSATLVSAYCNQISYQSDCRPTPTGCGDGFCQPSGGGCISLSGSFPDPTCGSGCRNYMENNCGDTCTCASSNPTCENIGGNCVRIDYNGIWPARTVEGGLDTPAKCHAEGTSCERDVGVNFKFNESCSDWWWDNGCTKVAVHDVCESSTTQIVCESKTIGVPWSNRPGCRWYTTDVCAPPFTTMVDADGQHYVSLGGPPPGTSACVSGSCRNVCYNYIPDSCPPPCTIAVNPTNMSLYPGQSKPATANVTVNGGTLTNISANVATNPPGVISANPNSGTSTNFTTNITGLSAGTSSLFFAATTSTGGFCSGTVNPITVSNPTCSFTTAPYTNPEPISVSAGGTVSVCATPTITPTGTPVGSSNWTAASGIISLASGTVTGSSCNAINGISAGSTTINVTVNLTPSGTCTKTLIPVTVTAPSWWQVSGGDVYGAGITSNIPTSCVSNCYIDLAN